MDYLVYVKDRLSIYERLGTETLPNGTQLIGSAKFIAPLAYLHSLFVGLSEAEVSLIEQKLGLQLPMPIRNFYNAFNGFNLFNSALSIYGLRNSQSRSISDSRQPYDIFLPNTEERILDAGPNIFFIGAYKWNGSKLYVDLSCGEVSFCSRESIAPIITWKSFEEMLKNEFDRLIALHTPEGKNIPFRPTVPVGGEDVLDRLIENAKKSKVRPYWFDETIKD